MIKTEPVAVTAAAALLVQAGAAALLPRAGTEVHVAISTLVVAAVVAVARKFSFSENTIRNAGLDPDSVERNAADPSVERCER